MEKFFSKPQKKNEYVSKAKEEGMSRRDFLKWIGVLGATAAAGNRIVDKLVSDSEKTANKEPVQQEEFDENIEIPDSEIPANEEDVEYNNHVDNVLRLEQMDKVTINEDVAKATEDYWLARYGGESPKLKKSMEDAYMEMQKWMPTLKAIFGKHKIPEKYVYLAIPESHWKQEVSPAGAAGVYQFIKDTAIKYELRVDDKVDERLDVKKSADACARLLKDLHDACGDWDLALSGYNGGFFWRYLEKSYAEKKKPSYAAFLKFIENRINGLIAEMKARKNWNHKIKPKESLCSIAKKYGLEISQIEKANQGEITYKDGNPIIVAGKELKIPFDDRLRKVILRDLIGGYRQNLNYPGKFNAVWKIIETPEFKKTIQAKTGKSFEMLASRE